MIAPGKRSSSSHNLTLAARDYLVCPSLGLCILAVGIVAAGFLIRQAASTRDVHGPFVPHLATEERITSNPPEAPVENAVVSRDGKYLAFHDNLGLYLRQIANGETRAWGLPKDFVAWPDDWFPDGTHLLVTRREGPSRTLSLWKLSLLGGNPEKLMDDAARGICVPGWIPDRLCARA